MKGSTEEPSSPESNTEPKSEETKAEAKYPAYLLVCEGYEDARFFERLIEEFELPRFYVVPAHGKNKIGGAIDGFRIAKAAAWSGLRHIIVVGDNDDVPDERFRSLCKQLTEIGLVAPTEPLKPSKSKPPITIIMLPGTETRGTLELLCQNAARTADKKHAEAIDTLLALINVAGWGSESRVGKAWLRANIAIRCTDPCANLGEMFEEPKYGHLIPVTKKDADIKRIADVLASCVKP